MPFRRKLPLTLPVSYTHLALQQLLAHAVDCHVEDGHDVGAGVGRAVVGDVAVSYTHLLDLVAVFFLAILSFILIVTGRPLSVERGFPRLCA